ncbi:hypothetical protein BH23GEM9_BH23GEM9_23380 [soil metagenome]
MPVERAALLMFHRDWNVTRDRVRLLRALNPDVPVHGLFGGESDLFDEAAAHLSQELDSLSVCRLHDGRWRWQHTDLVVRNWYGEKGHTLPFDLLNIVQWDLLLFEPLERLYAHVPPGAVALTGLTDLERIAERWHWTRVEPHRAETMALLELARTRWQYEAPPRACLGPGAALPRSFLDRYAADDIPVLGHDEVRLPLFAGLFGHQLVDTGFHAGWFDEEGERGFNANGAELPVHVVLDELRRPDGRRVFHPCRETFSGELLNYLLEVACGEAPALTDRDVSRQIYGVGAISVLMPTFNGARFLDRVLAALAEQQLDLPWDFLAIDSGSTDRTLEILQQWRSRFPVPLRVLHIHPSAFNHGDTRNLLAAESAGELLVFLTQDAVPTGPHWLHTLAANFADPTVGAAYSRNVPRADAPVLTRVFSEHDPGYAAGRREHKLPDAATYAAMTPHEKRLLFNLNDVAAAYRRSLWERHPFPRAEFGEDVLMARGLIEAGYTVVYDDVATVEHSHDYGPDEMRERTRIDGRFNVEWLDRVCVASRSDAKALTRRQLERDRDALLQAGVTGAELHEQIRYAESLRSAAFLGLYEGGLSRTRHPPTRMLDDTLLRVLYVVHGFPPDTWAGTEVYTLGLALEMKRRGHDVAILTRAPADRAVADGGPPDFTVQHEKLQGLPVFRMIHRLQHENLRASYDQPRAAAAFRQVVLEFRPDVVHFQHLIHLSATLPRICRELGIASLITVNDYWAICARVQLIRPDGVRCEQNQGLGCLLCVKEHHYPLIPAAKRVLPLLAPLAYALRGAGNVPGLARLAQHAGEYRDIAARHDVVCDGYAACDLAIAPSRFLRQKLLDTGRFDPQKVLYSDYGTLADNIRPIQRGRAEGAPLRIGYVGSLLWYKGVDLIIRAMQQLADIGAVLHIYGDFRPESDPYHATLADLARACGEAVVFHGRFDNRDLARVYESFDVLVVPSTWFENSPITIHESFLFRTPVLTSDIGGMAELVRDGADGLHFNAGDADDLAAKLARLATEPDLLPALTQFRHVRSMEEDAREMEVRYRGLAAIIRESGSRMFVDRPGWPAAARGGPVEKQGADLALLRPGGSWVEYDMALIGPGRIIVRIDVQVLGSEADVALGGGVYIDGMEIGRIDAFVSNGQDDICRFTFDVDLDSHPRRLRVDTNDGPQELHMRIARVVISEAAAAEAVAAQRDGSLRPV